MKIYIGHAKQWDYENNLYNPILKSKLNKEHEIILPHLNDRNFNTKDVIAKSDLFIAEVSKPSLGLGIEIGRAEQMGKKILCIYKKGEKVSSSIKYVDAILIEYNDEKDMIDKIKKEIEKVNK